MNIAKKYSIKRCNFWLKGLSVRVKRIWNDVNRIATAGFIFAFFAFILSGCVDADLNYDKAIITLADNRVIEVKVKNAWYGDTRFVDIVTDDGTEYRVHYMNVSFVKESQKSKDY